MSLLRSPILIRWLCLAWLFNAGCRGQTPTATVASSTSSAVVHPLQLTPRQLVRLRQALAAPDAEYDPAAQMLREPFASPGYHTTLTGGWTHSTRASLNYAVALLDTRDDARLPRAEDILRKVISLQDQDPAHATCGIWPWFLEEPLTRMSPPDWNWADFCGVQLLQAALDHRDRLPPGLAARLDHAILLAARSIQKRNVQPDYTNIAVMGAYVTLVAGELYNQPDLRDYGLAGVRRFYDYTRANGSFTEYNSPTYTVVALKELARLQKDARDPAARRLAGELYQLAWTDIARHFYAPARQWAGPHSRSYQTLLGQPVLSLIQRSTAGRVNFGLDQPAMDEARLPTPCPRELEHYFTSLDAPRDLRETILKGGNPLTGTTHLEPAFTLGSINRGSFWEQCRPLVAYWGTAANPGYFRVRLMHDGHDFSAAQFYSVQRAGDVLAGVNFATDGGDKHPSLDRIKNATITAENLALRFEFGGAAAAAKLVVPVTLGGTARVGCGPIQVAITVPCARLGDQIAHWAKGTDGTNSFLDVILYSGPKERINLAALDQAVAGFGIHVGILAGSEAAPAASLQDGRLQLQWQSLALTLPVKPDHQGVLQKSFVATGAE